MSMEIDEISEKKEKINSRRYNNHDPVFCRRFGSLLPPLLFIQGCVVDSFLYN